MSQDSRRRLGWIVFPLLFFLAATQVAPRGGSVAREAKSVDQVPVALEYVLERSAKPAISVQVTLDVTGTAQGRSQFAVYETWGGAADVGDEIRELKVFDASGRELPVQRPSPHRWVVGHPPGEPLRLTYNLHAARDGAQGRNRYLPVIADDLVVLIGHTALVYPEHLGENEPVNVQFRWRGFDEPDWKIVTSFGPCDDALQVYRPLGEILHAFYVAGEVSLYTRSIGEAPLHLAVADDAWRFGDDAFTEMVTRIMSFERSFFGDLRHPPYTVCLVPYPHKESDSSSSGGSCLTDSFILYLTPRGYARESTTGLEPLETLIAHEYYHNWNSPEPDGDAMHWFSEGFTVFYERRVLLRAGLFTPAEYVEHLNRSIRKYMTSPFKKTPNEEYVASRMLDRELQSLPYDRGAVIAVLVDHEIHRVSKGASNLDDLMREKDRIARATGAPPGNEAIFALIRKYTSADFARTIRAIAIDGAPAALATDTYGECLDMKIKALAPYELGFDFEASREKGSITNVQTGTRAHGAGLRNGQRLVGWSVTHGEADKPVSLTVLEDGKEKTISFLPQSAPVTVPQFSLRDGREAWCQRIL